MKNKITALTVCAMICGFCSPALAQQRGKIERVGILLPSSAEPDPRLESFKEEALRELGYVEGRNLAIEYRWANGRFEALPELAAELAGLKVDVIVSVVTQASVAAKKATATIPIVMVGVSDPVSTGLVAELARPGGNVTGTSSMTAEVVGKQLELLKETVPKVSRVAALWNPANTVFQKLQLKETESAAAALRLRLRIVEARSADEINRAFASMATIGTKALLVLGDPVFTSERQRIADLAVKGRLAAVGGTREHVEAGGLMSYGPSFSEMFRRAAYYVDRILKGTKPADLPVEQPKKFELIINLKAGKQIGLTIPPNVLARADRVMR
jgi:putative ABC transport system substrate-binding protein